MELKNFDKLVQSITSNILEKLELKTENNVYDKSCLILPAAGFGMKDYYTYINRQFPGYNQYIGKSKPQSNTQYGNNSPVRFIDIDFDNSDFISTLENVDRIIILGLKISQMKTLIESDDSEDVNHVILGSLMVNKPVTLLLNTNKAMYQKMKTAVKDIKNMGINVVNIQQWGPSNSRTVKSTTIKSNELITEDYVRKLGQNGSKVIVLHKKQLITPLAKDKLRELKIEIKYVKEDKS